jgi:hypothetical protein
MSGLIDLLVGIARSDVSSNAFMNWRSLVLISPRRI